MKKNIYNFILDEHGATVAEYAIMAAAIALAVIAIVFALGKSVAGLFESYETEYNKVETQ